MRVSTIKRQLGSMLYDNLLVPIVHVYHTHATFQVNKSYYQGKHSMSDLAYKHINNINQFHHYYKIKNNRGFKIVKTSAWNRLRSRIQNNHLQIDFKHAKPYLIKAIKNKAL